VLPLSEKRKPLIKEYLMKKGVVVLASLALVLAFCVPAVAQPSPKSVETIVIDNFDNEDKMDWTWKVQASRSATLDTKTNVQYPILQYFDGIPNSLRPIHKEGDPIKVLGVKVKFDRKGDNWLEIFPEYKDRKDKNGAPVREIPFVGTVSQIDFWAWGAGYLYYIEVLVRDAEGRVHALDGGNLAFNGWKDIIVHVPTWFPQRSSLRSGAESMSLVGFRIRSDSRESVDDYVIYLDQIKYVSNTLDNIYDGYELKNADFGDDKTNSTSSGSSTTEK